MKAQKIHRELVDVVRMLQISHGGSGVVATDSQDSDDDGDERELVARINNANSLDSLNGEWQNFSQSEARKRCDTSMGTWEQCLMSKQEHLLSLLSRRAIVNHVQRQALHLFSRNKIRLAMLRESLARKKR